MDSHQELDPLKRFIDAQAGVYARALDELRAGRKQTHWMWFIFPQIEGLGSSETSRFYSIKNIDEARLYIAHRVLGSRLKECVSAILGINGKTALQIFGTPDDLKLRSSMTLYAKASAEPRLFEDALIKYFNGQMDQHTLEILAQMATKGHE